jgi:hypothetical protein
MSQTLFFVSDSAMDMRMAMSLSLPLTRGGRMGVVPTDCSPTCFDTGPVGSTAHPEHSLFQADILAVPSSPGGFQFWFARCGNQQIENIYFPFADC